MKRLALFLVFVFLFALAACQSSPAGSVAVQGAAQDLGVCPTVPVYSCALQTATPGASPALTRTPTASRTPTPTLTATPAELPTERIANGGFEGSWRPVIFPEVNVFVDWEPFYCDTPYAPYKCPAERRDTQIPPRPGYNSPDLLMGRPELKPSDVAGRVHSGQTAQQWFCFFRTCRAGVYQTIATQPGEVCHISAWVQTWSAKDEYGTDGIPYHSLTLTADDRANSTWFIKVDPSGGTYAFAPFLLSQAFGYSSGHFDQYAEIRMTFVATGPSATVFLENLRLWPFAHNDSYLDDVSVKCALPGEPSPTPAPSATASPTPTATATAIPASSTPTPITPPAPTPAATPLGGDQYPRFAKASIDYTVLGSSLRIRNQPSLFGTVVGYRTQGAILHVRCFYEYAADGDVWASGTDCLGPDKTWMAVYVGGVIYMKAVEGPVGSYWGVGYLAH